MKTITVIALLAAVLALVIALLAYIKSRNSLTYEQAYGLINPKIKQSEGNYANNNYTQPNAPKTNVKEDFINERHIEEIIKSNQSIKKHIENVVINMPNQIKDYSFDDNDISKISDLVFEKVCKMLNDKDNHAFEKQEDKGTYDTIESRDSHITNVQSVSTKKIYATSAKEDDGFFYDVYETYDHDDVIFVLEISGSDTRAKFYVFSNAAKRIIDTPDYLNGACKIQRMGNSEVVTESPGEAVLFENKWKVEKLANVILK